VHAPQAQEACLGRRTVWGQASKGDPGSQSLIGGSLRRPAKVSEPYWGKPQDATLGPGALLGQASGSQPASQSLIGGSLKKPPFVPEPYWGKPPLRTFCRFWRVPGPKMAQDGPKTAQNGPSRPQEGPKRPRMAPRTAQDGRKMRFLNTFGERPPVPPQAFLTTPIPRVPPQLAEGDV